MATRSLSAAVKSLCFGSSGTLSVSTVFRRSYVVTSQNVTAAAGFSNGGSTRATVGKMEQRVDQETESAWSPDPLTGYYRPSNRAAEIDPAELREMLLKNRAKSF